MQSVWKGKPWVTGRTKDGRWFARDDSVGVSVIASILEASNEALGAVVLARLEVMSDEEHAEHLARLEHVWVDHEGNEIQG